MCLLCVSSTSDQVKIGVDPISLKMRLHCVGRQSNGLLVFMKFGSVLELRGSPALVLHKLLCSKRRSPPLGRPEGKSPLPSSTLEPFCADFQREFLLFCASQFIAVMFLSSGLTDTQCINFTEVAEAYLNTHSCYVCFSG